VFLCFVRISEQTPIIWSIGIYNRDEEFLPRGRSNMGLGAGVIVTIFPHDQDVVLLKRKAGSHDLCTCQKP